ncbi:MAG TPA: DUF4396 domain-containing protein [Candidatus Limnocylindrales bacterium]
MTSRNRTAFDATVHCLTGCAIGEVAGLVLSNLLNLAVLPSIVVSIALSFVFGYGLTIRPLLAAAMPFRQAFRIAIASDTVSLVAMEATDNAIVLAVPGAMTANLNDLLFWASLALSLVVAFAVALPINRWLIDRGLGHAVLLEHGGHGGHGAHEGP